MEVWVKDGLGCWKNAMNKRYLTNSLHQTSTEALDNLKLPNVYQCMVEGVDEQMIDHRKALLKIFSTLKVMGQQRIALQGHGNNEKSNFIRILTGFSEDVCKLNNG